MKVPDLAKFRDAKDREWWIKIGSINDVKRIREKTGIKIEDLVTDGYKPLDALLSDYAGLVNVLWHLEGYKKGISEEDFGEGFVGDVLLYSGLAFVRALINFFPKETGKMLERNANKAWQIHEIQTAKTAKFLESINPEKYVQNPTTYLQTLLPDVTNSADSSALIPVP